MSNINKVILHIGLPKTGTSAIQRALFLNRNILKTKKGILYPASIANEYGHHHAINHFITSIEKGKVAKKFKKHLNEFTKELNQDEVDTLFLSSEIFTTPFFQSNHNLAKTKIFFDDILGLRNVQIKIILFVRRPSDFIESSYNQRVKIYNLSSEISNVSTPCDFLFIHNLWKEFFPDAEIITKEYKNTKEENAVSVMTDILDIQTNDLIIPEDDANPGLTAGATEFLRIINKNPMNEGCKKRFLDILRDYEKKNPMTFKSCERIGKSVLSNKNKNSIDRRYAEIWKALGMKDLIMADEVESESNSITNNEIEDLLNFISEILMPYYITGSEPGIKSLIVRKFKTIMQWKNFPKGITARIYKSAGVE